MNYICNANVFVTVYGIRPLKNQYEYGMRLSGAVSFSLKFRSNFVCVC